MQGRLRWTQKVYGHAAEQIGFDLFQQLAEKP
jgi:hypothetical protein